MNCNAGVWKNLSTNISLMYASDYALSLGSSVLSYTSVANVDILKTEWLYLDNNDDNPAKMMMNGPCHVWDVIVQIIVVLGQ